MDQFNSFQQPAVLGSGDQGLKIAALFANAGMRVKLYDVGTETDAPTPSQAALARIFQLQPPPLAGIEAVSLIIPRDYRRHWRELAEHDLIIEAYELPHAAKQSWLTRLAPGFARNAVIVSLSRGESIAALGAVLPAGMRPHFLGARFSQAPRLQRLVEVIPSLRSEERLTAQLMRFLKDGLGLKPRQVADEDNFLLLRLWLFLLCSAFAHGRSLSPVELEAATTMLFSAQGGIHHFLAQMGPEESRQAHARLDEAEKQRFFPLLEWPQALNAPLPPPQAQPLPLELQQLWLRRDWVGLRAYNHPCAEFICRYLRDCWQYLAHISQSQSLAGADIDVLLSDGIGWSFMPWQCLQEFDPKRIYADTLAEESRLAYPISGHWRRRPRPKRRDARHAEDEFTRAARLIHDGGISRRYLYREELLIWQPLAEEIDTDCALLKDLQAAIDAARRSQSALMIYHRGSRFGLPRDWRQAGQDAALRSGIDCLSDCLLALRMHPRFVIFAGGGTLLDAGIALMLQADRVISDADLSWQLSTFSQGLPGIGAIWFEWLRRLPQLSSELSRLQTATVLEKLLQDSGIHTLHGARDSGLLRSHDRYVMHAGQLPNLSRKMADAWIESDNRRALRYPLYKLSPADLDWHLKRAEHSPDPQRYRELIGLLADEGQQQILSLRRFLHSESALFFQSLGQAHDSSHHQTIA